MVVAKLADATERPAAPGKHHDADQQRDDGQYPREPEHAEHDQAPLAGDGVEVEAAEELLLRLGRDPECGSALDVPLERLERIRAAEHIGRYLALGREDHDAGRVAYPVLRR